MIVYNVQRRFFELKNDAEEYRRSQNLPPAATHKITIINRNNLAEFLNAMSEGKPAMALQGVEPMPIADDAYDFIPDFIKRDWQERRRFRKAGAS